MTSHVVVPVPATRPAVAALGYKFGKPTDPCQSQPGPGADQLNNLYSNVVFDNFKQFQSSGFEQCADREEDLMTNVCTAQNEYADAGLPMESPRNSPDKLG